MPLSLQKHLSSAGMYFGIGLFAGLSFGAMGAMCGLGTIGGVLAGLIPCLLGLLLAIYQFRKYLDLKKKCKEITPSEGVIFNWEGGKYNGNVIIKVDGKEYKSSADFSHTECQEMVGKTVLYAIIDSSLFIYEVKE